MFEPGARVVCINDTFPAGTFDYYNALPRKGKGYTVRDIMPGVGLDGRETTAVFLVECVNRPNRHGIEPGFAPWRFREVEMIEDEYEELRHEQRR